MGIAINATNQGALSFLGETVLGTAGNTITVNNIPSGFRYLHCYFSLNTAAGGNTVQCILNNDSGNNYYWEMLVGNGAAASSLTNGGIAYFQVAYLDTAKPNTGQLIICQQPTTINRTFSVVAGEQSYCQVTGGHYASTSYITRIDFNAGANLGIGSSLTVYGIK